MNTDTRSTNGESGKGLAFGQVDGLLCLGLVYG